MKKPLYHSRETYLAAGGSPEHETAVLSIGSEFLPDFARDGGEGQAHDVYWHWLTEQLESEDDRLTKHCQTCGAVPGQPCVGRELLHASRV